MSVRRPLWTVTIDGVEVPCFEARTQHDVDQPIGTGRIVLSAPRPSVADLAAPVRIDAGYDGEGMATIFDGRLSEDARGFDERGGEVTIEVEGWGKLLWYPNHVDQAVAGPVKLNDLFNAFATDRGVPLFAADDSTNPDGSDLVFGGVAEVDGGDVLIETDESPGQALDRLGRLGGYRAFDTPNGYHLLRKISGLPSGFYEDPEREYVEGENIFSVRRSETLAGMVNYWDVRGAKYTASDGSEVAVRSFPASLDADERLGPSGVNRKRVSAPDLLTNTRADHARNVLEIDRSTPAVRYSWVAEFDPWVHPGMTVTVTSPTIHGYENPTVEQAEAAIEPVTMWLMHVEHAISDGMWTTTMEGWMGAGEALPAGNDCTTTTILGSAGKHYGNEYLWHYRRPNPDGLTITIPFPVAEDYSTLTIRGIAHGTNSFVRNQESEATRFEIWQDRGSGLERVASGDIPSLKENLEKRYPYGQQVSGSYTNKYWEPIVVPLTGTLTADPDGDDTELRIISGKDSDVGDYDDGEVANLVLTTCGVGTPEVIVP